MSATEVYRCLDEQGGLKFQQHACAPGAGGKIEVPEAAMRWDALRPSERRLVEQYRRAERVVYPPPGKKPRAGERTCWKKRRQLKRVSERLRQGYRVSEGRKLKGRREDLQDYLDRYCE